LGKGNQNSESAIETAFKPLTKTALTGSARALLLAQILDFYGYSRLMSIGRGELKWIAIKFDWFLTKSSRLGTL
jgi:uncharacterized PurR-regulated membrane protein YhhQ (DUF165 family)